jgi:hypothetical protein
MRNELPNHALENLITLCSACHTRRHGNDPSLPLLELRRRKQAGVSAMTAEQLSAARKKTAETLGSEGRSARVRRAWANMTPEARARRAEKAATSAAKSSTRKSASLKSAWAGLTPEQRAARIQRAADGARKSRPAAAAKLRERLARLTPEERHERGVRLAAARWGHRGSAIEISHD